jgi:hypothetical protein
MTSTGSFPFFLTRINSYKDNDTKPNKKDIDEERGYAEYISLLAKERQ